MEPLSLGQRRALLLIRRVARLPAFAVLVGLVVVAAPAESYLFWGRFGGTAIPSAAGATHRPRPEHFPLTFQLAGIDDLPTSGGVTADEVRGVVESAIAHWNQVPTAEIAILVGDETVVVDEGNAADGINTIAFPDRGGSAVSRSEDGEWVECDITLGARFRRSRLYLERTLVHELGHCLGLLHSAKNPMWLDRPLPKGASTPSRGHFPRGITLFQADPAMSYGEPAYGLVGLTPDDALGVSLLHPAAGFWDSRGSIGGRVVFSNGDPAPFVYVQTVEYSQSRAVFGPGAFTDALGQFVLEGLSPGPTHLWIHPIKNLSAHRFSDQAAEGGSLDMLDSQRWATVRAGETTTLGDVRVERGREPSP